MLRFGDFVMCRKTFLITVGVYMSASEHCSKMKLRAYFHVIVISKVY